MMTTYQAVLLISVKHNLNLDKLESQTINSQFKNAYARLGGHGGACL